MRFERRKYSFLIDTSILIFILIFHLFSLEVLAQDTTKYPWPLLPTNQSKTLSATFCEYRSTSASGHYHNAVDIPASAGTPVVAVLPGTVYTLNNSDPTGYDNYIKIRSVMGSYIKYITYYHTNPVKSVGQTVSAGETISTIAIDHVHLIEYYYLNSSLEINPVRPDGGLTPFVDVWKPQIMSVRFFVDESTTQQLSPSAIGGKVDMIVHIQEKNGPGSGSGTNNGSYGIGYKILSADTQTVVYNPPTNSLRFQYYNKPYDSDVNYNYFRPEATTSNHVYIITNGNGATDVSSTRRVQNNYWDASLLPNGNYVVMIYTFDTRGNADTVYIPIVKTDIDLIPPEQTNFLLLTSVDQNQIKLEWEQNNTSDLKGHRLYFSYDNKSWNLRDNENVLTTSVTSKVYNYSSNQALYFRIFAIDQAPIPNVSIQSDVYGLKINSGKPNILIVDGFDRTNGSYSQRFHDFVTYYGNCITSNFSSCSNDAIINSKVNLADYDFVIWFLGDESVNDETFNTNEQEKIKSYLRQGGKLLITGSEVGYDLFEQGGSEDRYFFNNFLKSGYIEDNSGSYVVNGEPNTVFSNLSFNYGIKSQGAPYDEDYPDVLDTLGGSQILLRYGNNKISAVGYKGIFEGGIKAGSVMLIGFPFETVHTATSRQNLFNAILRYFDFQTSVENYTSNQINEDVLDQNFPNPFNNSTIIRFRIANDNQVKIVIYNLMGEVVKNFDLGFLKAGAHQFIFNSNDVSSGVYYYNLITNNNILSNKMMIIK